MSKSDDLTNLEMEEFPELPAKLIACIESKKIKHLKLLQVGPAQVLASTIKVLAPNLESFALGETDLTQDQLLELLAALPVGLKHLRLSSSKINHDLLAASELSELLNNVLELDLTNCTAINTEAVAMLTRLQTMQRLVLTGCTGISDNDFYATIYLVQSKSLLQVVTHHGNSGSGSCFSKLFLTFVITGDVLEYQNDYRKVYINRIANNTQYIIKAASSEVNFQFDERIRTEPDFSLFRH